MDILSRSLNEAPLHEENVPTLFFLAESALYWLHVDAMKQAYLRSAEIKLLKVSVSAVSFVVKDIAIGTRGLGRDSRAGHRTRCGQWVATPLVFLPSCVAQALNRGGWPRHSLHAST